MKTTLKLALLWLLLCSVRCSSLYYMPFKETSTGKNAISMYIDGEAFKTVDIDIDTGIRTEMDSLKTKIALCGTVISDHHTGMQADIRMTILVEEGDTLEAGKDYRITEYTVNDFYNKDEEYWNEPHVRMAIGNRYAHEGWVHFRCLTRKIAAGNFEFTFLDDDFVSHSVMYGNFDSMVNIIPKKETSEEEQTPSPLP